MRELVFDHYVPIAQIGIGVGFLALLLGLLVFGGAGRLRRFAVGAAGYTAVVGLGMSEDIKFLSPLGLLHALTALAIAIVLARYLRTRVAWLLFLPCAFIGFVVLHNLGADQSGLELLGRWTRAPVGG
ncbi:MAG: hypothetical protein AAGE01_19375 [Pseudomonadota bacterium]